jgi:hypothetical protein
MTIDPQCTSCRHLDRVAMASLHIMRCTAYPEEIPREIAGNKHDHRKPFPGDHGIRFEPLKPEPSLAQDVKV